MIQFIKSILLAKDRSDGTNQQLESIVPGTSSADNNSRHLLVQSLSAAVSATGLISSIRLGDDSTDYAAAVGARTLLVSARLQAWNGAGWDRPQVDGNKQLKTTEQAYNFTNTNPAVTNASSVILAANAGRKFLMIQNKDAAGNIYIVFGAAATVALGIKIAPGQTLTLDAKVPAGGINAIGDIANNPNVVVVEG